MEKIIWAIFYGEGTVFTNLDGNPENAPTQDVQIILQKSTRVEWEMLRMVPFYAWRYGHWERIEDDVGYWDFVFYPYESKIIKVGRKIPDDIYDKIYYFVKEERKQARDTGAVRLDIATRFQELFVDDSTSI